MNNLIEARVNKNKKILTKLGIAGFLFSMVLGILYSIFLIAELIHSGVFLQSLLIGDVIKIIFSFCIAWILRGNYMNTLDTMVAKMEVYEMKVLKEILEYEIEKDENGYTDDKREKLTNKLNNIKK